MIRLGVLISGGGTTLQNLIDKIAAGQLDASIVVVVSSRSDAYGLQRARQAGLATEVISPGEHGADFSRHITQTLQRYGAELVVMGGFLSLYEIPPAFAGRVMNIHPALLPGFGGKGMYGLRVHEAVLAAGCKVSGCTVHFADNQYDHGPIIIQRCVPVEEDDTPETLAARVFQQECIAYPEAIRLFAAGRLRIEGRRVRILPPRQAS